MKKSRKYDYLIVGAGLFGSTFAYLASKAGKRCLVIDKRNHIGGNCYSRKQFGIDVHLYGPHIFHTSNKEIWNFVDSISPMRSFINQPLANYNGEIYNLPFNMNTFHKIFGKNTPEDIMKCIEETKIANASPQNLEEFALATVGSMIYERLIKGYTEKQWGRKCTELPVSILKRLPLRMTYDNAYFDDEYQGVPVNGYGHLFSQLLKDCDVAVGIDFFEDENLYRQVSDKILYTGRLDDWFKFGNLEFRGLNFKHEIHNISNYQGCAVMNFTDADTPYTRITEHKHFNPLSNEKFTVLTYEYPSDGVLAEVGECYPVPLEYNLELQRQYEQLAMQENNVIFGGRLADYKYYNMDTTIENAIKLWKRESKL